MKDWDFDPLRDHANVQQPVSRLENKPPFHPLPLVEKRRRPWVDRIGFPRHAATGLS
jgi:hypothetical protein